jgi:hypothetical protein
MISTKNLQLLPDYNTLKSICKAIAVLDAIISPEWEYRYYSFNREWCEEEEICEMRNGEGDQMLILFCEEGCTINGFAHEYEQQDKEKLTKGLPPIFHDFIYGEPVNSIGTTFCLWTTQSNQWQLGELTESDDNSDEMLSILDGRPETYIDWAKNYFEDAFKRESATAAISKIYGGEALTKEMVLSIADLEDFDHLEADLKEIGYPYNFN